MHKEKVSDPEDFVNNIESLTVIHCDQIPIWVKIGSMRSEERKGGWQSGGWQNIPSIV